LFVVAEVEVGESSVGVVVGIIGVELDGFCVAVDGSLILFIFVGLISFLFMFESLCFLIGGH
jgi:hypothetical protein